MSQQIINRGASAGDVSAETLYPAFGKVNSNFSEVYAAASFARYVAGQFYPTVPLMSYLLGAAWSANTLRMIPVFIREACTIDQIAARVTTAAAGGNVQFGLYAADATTNLPTGPALGTTPNVSVAATGNVTGALGTSIQITVPGLYWVAMFADSAPTFLAQSNATPAISHAIGGTVAQILVTNTTTSTFLTYTATFGTWPDVTGVAPAYQSTLAFAAVAYRVASIP